MSSKFSLVTYIHISWRNQTATGWAWFDCGDLHINRRGLLGVRHLFNFVCKIKWAIVHEQQKQQGQDLTCKALVRFSWAKRKLIIHSDPSLCLQTELRMKLKQKTLKQIFFGRGQEDFDEMCRVCPALQAVQALSKQPTQQHHPTLRVVPSLNVKWAMNVKSVKFAVIFLSFIFSSLQRGKGVNGKFGRTELPSGVWWCHQIEST